MLYDLVYQLTQKELRVRYKNLSLGYIWSLANPLAYSLLYFFVFGRIMKVKVENFPIFLITGMFSWQWFANSIGVGSWTFLGNASLIKKVNFPRNLLSLVAVGQDMIHFFASVPIIIAFLLAYGLKPSFTWIIGIPLLAIAQLALTYGANLFIATINLFFRDLERLVQIAMTFLFYATPVVYELKMVPEEYRSLIFLNPVAPIVISWRELFLAGEINPYYLGLSYLWGALALIIGQITYKRLSWRFAEIL